MAYIPPLELKTWILTIFSGSTEIFTAIALFFIMSMAGYFRMTLLTSLFMAVIFLAMFTGYVDKSILSLVVSVGGLLAGYWISKIVKN